MLVTVILRNSLTYFNDILYYAFLVGLKIGYFQFTMPTYFIRKEFFSVFI